MKQHFMTTLATLTQDTQTGNYADPAVRLALNRLCWYSCQQELKRVQ